MLQLPGPLLTMIAVVLVVVVVAAIAVAMLPGRAGPSEEPDGQDTDPGSGS